MKNKCDDHSHTNVGSELKEIKVCDVSEEKIACINLAYANGELIKALIERTNILNKGRTERLNEIEGKINQMCMLKQNKFKRPVTAFITF